MNEDDNINMTPYLQNIFKKRIGELMQICIHRKDNSPKPVNHRLPLKEGPKVKSGIRRFQAHDILQVGLTLRTTRINNKLEDRSQKKR